MHAKKNITRITVKQNTLDMALKTVSTQCNDCGHCLKHCKFLKRYGTPKQIADTYDSEKLHSYRLSFNCNLCGLCTAVCPKGIDPVELFHCMRCEAVAGNKINFSPYKRLLKYEARGISSRYTWHGFPEGCDTVFFPGCTLPGTRPGQTMALFRTLQRHIPALGIALDCCTKPSHDLGRMQHFNNAFEPLKNHLLRNGIKTIIVACPNCYVVFKKYGTPLQALTAYDVLATAEPSTTSIQNKISVIHDPCAIRFESHIHSSIRQLAEKSGIQLMEMPHNKTKTLCCGEGGAVSCQSPELSRNWSRQIASQSNSMPIVTYCAGCAAFLSAVTPTRHILDMIFSCETAKPFRSKVYRPPLTYINRLRLKKYMRHNFQVKISGTRPFR